MITKVFPLFLCAAAIVAIWSADPTRAATLKNLDAAEHHILIVEGDRRQEHKVSGRQELSGLCETSCSLYLDLDPEPCDLVAADKVQIVKGVMYYVEEPDKDTPTP